MIVRQIPQCRSRRIAAFNHANHFPGMPIGRVTVFRQVPGSGRVVVIAHAVGEMLSRVALLRQEKLVVIYGAVLSSSLLGQDYVVDAYLHSQIGNPEGQDKPNKKQIDPRGWIHLGEKGMVERLKIAFDDLNSTGKFTLG